MMTPFAVQNARLCELAAEVRSYSGSDASRALVLWLDMMTDIYKEDLVTCTPVDLVALQSKVTQLAALRQLAAGTHQINGRV